MKPNRPPSTRVACSDSCCASAARKSASAASMSARLIHNFSVPTRRTVPSPRPKRIGVSAACRARRFGSSGEGVAAREQDGPAGVQHLDAGDVAFAASSLSATAMVAAESPWFSAAASIGAGNSAERAGAALEVRLELLRDRGVRDPADGRRIDSVFYIGEAAEQ